MTDYDDDKNCVLGKNILIKLMKLSAIIVDMLTSGLYMIYLSLYLTIHCELNK